MNKNFTVTPMAMVPVPISWWRKLWLRLLRRPLPTRAPEGTRSLVIETGDGRRYYFPAVRIEADES